MSNYIKVIETNEDKLIKFLEKCDNKVTNIKFKDDCIQVQMIADASTYKELGHLDEMIKTLNAHKSIWANPYGSNVRTIIIYNNANINYDRAGAIKQQSLKNVEDLMQAFFCKVCPGYKEEFKKSLEKKYNTTLNNANEMEF